MEPDGQKQGTRDAGRSGPSLVRDAIERLSRGLRDFVRVPDDLDSCRTSGDVYVGAFNDAAVMRLYESRGYKADIGWDGPVEGVSGRCYRALRINGVDTGWEWGYVESTGPDGSYAWCVTHANTRSYVREESAAKALLVMAYARTNGRKELDRPFDRAFDPRGSQRDEDRTL